eukprot:PhM_4_TR2762/c0_g1_i1/m.89245
MQTTMSDDDHHSLSLFEDVVSQELEDKFLHLLGGLEELVGAEPPPPPPPLATVIQNAQQQQQQQVSPNSNPNNNNNNDVNINSNNNNVVAVPQQQQQQHQLKRAKRKQLPGVIYTNTIHTCRVVGATNHRQRGLCRACSGWEPHTRFARTAPPLASLMSSPSPSPIQQQHQQQHYTPILSAPFLDPSSHPRMMVMTGRGRTSPNPPAVFVVPTNSAVPTPSARPGVRPVSHVPHSADGGQRTTHSSTSHTHRTHPRGTPTTAGGERGAATTPDDQKQQQHQHHIEDISVSLRRIEDMLAQGRAAAGSSSVNADVVLAMRQLQSQLEVMTNGNNGGGGGFRHT